MKKLSILLALLLLILSNALFPLHALAAEFRADDSVFLSETETTLEDLYVAGNDVTIEAPVQNDLTAAGNTVTINGDVTGSLMAAGSNLTIRSNVGNTTRVAGGNVAISGSVARDLIIFAGTATITKDASISGDLIVFGGELLLQGPVEGDVIVYGGDIRLNNTIGGNVTGTMGTLILEKDAVINGDLSYESEQRAEIKEGAEVRGQQTFKQYERKDKDKADGIAKAFSAGSIYSLFTDIIISILFLYFFPRFLRQILARAKDSPVKSVSAGFLVLILTPVVSFFLLFLLFLGLFSFVAYILLLLFSMYLSKILLGWFLVRWWKKRENTEYVLDWKAAIVGPVALFVLMLIPIIGWLFGFILFLMALGALVQELTAVLTAQRPTPIAKPTTE